MKFIYSIYIWAFLVIGMCQEGPHSRIVGGRETTIERFPYLVSLQLLSQSLCGGAILDNRTIITAAHCIDNTRNPEELSVRVGSTHRTSGGQVYQIEKVIVHELFTMDTMNNDIAILHTTSPIEFDNVAPIPLPQSDEDPPEGNVSTISGWGSTYLGGNKSETLRMVHLPIINQGVCREANEDDTRRITDKMFCAGSMDGGIDSCQGDSGGPLVIDGILYGLVSWGRGCGESKLPGLYTNVPKFLDWIRENSY